VAYRKEKKGIKKSDGGDNSASDNETGGNKGGHDVTKSFRLDESLDCSYWGTPKSKCKC
tara:strand:- start:78 stop:254 length:177 start_codon:yes stop_codon:yes gene_type:complete